MGQRIPRRIPFGGGAATPGGNPVGGGNGVGNNPGRGIKSGTSAGLITEMTGWSEDADGHLVPTANNTYSLGTTANKVKDVKAAGDLVVGGTATVTGNTTLSGTLVVSTAISVLGAAPATGSFTMINTGPTLVGTNGVLSATSSAADGANSARVAYVTAPVASSWRWTVDAQHFHSQNPTRMGILVGDSGTGKFVSLTILASQPYLAHFEVAKWTTATSFSAAYAIGNDVNIGVGARTFLCIDNNGTNFSFRWGGTPVYAQMMELLSVANNDWLAAINMIGIYTSANTSGFAPYLYINGWKTE